MNCEICHGTGFPLTHGWDGPFCSCAAGQFRLSDSAKRTTSNRTAINAYRTASHEPCIATGPFPDTEVRNCHSQILTSLSIMDRCKRRDLVRVVCSHDGCESRIQVERELDELIDSKQVGLDPGWDLNSTDGDDIVYHIVKPEWQPTKEQEAACEVRKIAAHKSRIANLWICIGAFAVFLSILYAVIWMAP